MKIADLTAVQSEKIVGLFYDCIIEKHEGPHSWKSEIEYSNVEFLSIDNFQVLLPIDVEHHANITILRCVSGQKNDVLTVFLKDTTHIENESDEFFQSGFLAICDRVESEEFFVATVYHEWFLVPRGRKPRATTLS